MLNFACFNIGDYINILITVHVKRFHMNYDNLFMCQSHPRSLKQVFRNGSKINEQTLLIPMGFGLVYFMVVSIQQDIIC